MLTISRSVDLAASPQNVWATLGRFDGLWHPLVATTETTGIGIGQLRRIDTIDGKVIIERLTGLDEAQRTLTYALVSGVPASRYEGTIEVQPKGTGSTVTWRVKYRPDGQAELIVHTIVSTLLGIGLDSLKERFGSAP